jgi:hypothetical protein
MTDKSSEGTRLAIQAQKKPEAFEALMVHYQQQLFLYILKYIGTKTSPKISFKKLS